MSRRARGAALALVGALALAAARYGLGAGSGSETRVRRGDLVLTVPAIGLLEALESADLGPPAIADVYDFKISFLAPEGSEVRAGQPVLGFDTSQLERRLEEERGKAETARRELEKREADLELERLDLELRRAEAEARQRKARLKAEVPEGLEARRELAKARAELGLADREVAFLGEQLAALGDRERAERAQLAHRLELAESAVERIESSIAAMRVAAPRDGTVIYVLNWRGEKKKIGDPVWRQERVLSIPDLARLRGRAEIPEADAGRVRVGLPVALRLDAHPDRVYRARVARLDTAVQRQSPMNPAKIVRAELELEETDPERMRPGMRFRAEIEHERAAAVLLAPLAALDLASGAPSVERLGWLDGERIEPRLGRRNATEVEVLEGLAEGDRLRLRRPEEAP